MAAMAARRNREAAGEEGSRFADLARRFRSGLPALLLVVGVAVAYVPALRAGFVWDDDFYVTDNPTLRDAAGLGRIWLKTDANPQYYPVTFTTFWLQYRVGGIDPFGYHLLNVLLHAGSALLLWRVLRKLRIPGALLAGWIFGLHPVMVESVAWVTERKNVLSGILFLVSALLFLRFSLGDGEEGRASDRPAGPRRLAALSLALFVLALLAKSVTATLPVALALLIVWKRRRVTREEAVWLGAMLAIGAGMGLLTARLESLQVGARGADWSLTAVQKTLLASRLIVFYLGKLVWPSKLAFFYERWAIDAGNPAAYLFPAAIAAAAAALWRLRRRIGGGPLVAFLYFGIVLFPALGFFRVYPMRYSWAADHFQYLAALGPIALLSAALAVVSANWAAGDRRARTAAAIPVLALLGALTWRQAGDYRDLETLWRRTVEKSPRAFTAHCALAGLLGREGDGEGAARHFELAIEAKPDYADALNSLGTIRAGQRRVTEAIDLYRRALRAAPENAIVHYNLAGALEASGRADEAMAEFETAIRCSPDPSKLGNDVWLALYRRGMLSPPPGRAQRGLARLLAERGRARDAIGHYRLALTEDPSSRESLLEMGRLLTDTGDQEEAAHCFESALRLEPRDPAAHLEMGLVQERRGDLSRALLEYRETIRLDPRSAVAHHNLAVVLLRTGDTAGAWRETLMAKAGGLEARPEFLRELSSRMPRPPTAPP
ncbi:MAG: tetratricopeptide repeat protein [Acidobacteriia bacterium]|nr:tetratricopeptide repeat protein [Terriglobia bacterium]